MAGGHVETRSLGKVLQPIIVVTTQACLQHGLERQNRFHPKLPVNLLSAHDTGMHCQLELATCQELNLQKTAVANLLVTC